MSEIKQLKQQLLNDFAVIAEDEFDKNFERKAFFDQPWAARRAPDIGSLLMRTGALRRSLTYDIRESSIVVSSSMPYAIIHNEGGQIPITARMRKFWMRKYIESGKKDSRALAMAITKKQHISIPKRQFVGAHPELTRQMQKSAELRITKWAERYIKDKLKGK